MRSGLIGPTDTKGGTVSPCTDLPYLLGEGLTLQIISGGTIQHDVRFITVDPSRGFFAEKVRGGVWKNQDAFQPPDKAVLL